LSELCHYKRATFSWKLKFKSWKLNFPPEPYPKNGRATKRKTVTSFENKSVAVSFQLSVCGRRKHAVADGSQKFSNFQN
jgi:hypothetical protein